MMMDADDDFLERRLNGDEFGSVKSNETDENAEPPTDIQLLNDLLKEGDKRRVVPKIRVVRPQPKLREQELCGRRGIMALKKMFDGYKPDPKKDPYEKLADMMNKIEYWAHLLHPKMKFEDVIAHIETLGGKRAVKTYMEKMRMNMPLTDEDFGSPSKPDDTSPSKAREENAASESAGTSAIVTNPPNEDYDDFIDDFYNDPSSVTVSKTPEIQAVSQPVELTEAQRQRIAENKRRAEELRARREAMLNRIEQPSTDASNKTIPSQNTIQNASSTEQFQSQNVSATEISTDMMDDNDAMDYIFSAE